MSYERGLCALRLEMPDEIPQVEYISHDEFIREVTGVDTRNPEERGLAWPALARALDFDFAWNICEAPLMRGRVTKLGHADWSASNPKDEEVSCPFVDVEEVLCFDPVAEYGMPAHGELVRLFQENLDETRRMYPDAVVPGGRYHSLFSACIRAFGWELFMMAGRCDEARFGRVLDGFAAITQGEINAWLETDMEVFLMHDDICWTSGAVFAPDWYRRYVFPKYVDFWKQIRASGRKVVFCSDGDWTQFVDDVADAGADGFIFEPCTSLDYVCSRYGNTHVIMGNADCRVLQFGSRDEVRREVERCVALGGRCPGYFMATGNHIPNGIPLDNIHCYFETFRSLRRR